MKTTLIAPCGMNCAICLAFLRKKNRCEGCWSPERECSKNCTIFACTMIQDRYHHNSTEFPCKRRRQLDQRYKKNTG